MEKKVMAEYDIFTAQDLFQALEDISKDPALKSAIDATVEDEMTVFTKLQIIERKLSDGSKVLDFWLS